MFRCSASDAVGQSIERFIPQRFRSQHAGHIRRFGETGVTSRGMGTLGALWALRADGEEFQIEASISPIETRGKKLSTVSLRDGAERKQAEAELARRAAELARSEQALRVQTRMFQSVLDSMDEGLVTADENGKFLLWNPAAEKILGMGAMDLSIQEWAPHYGCYLPDAVTPFPTDQLPLVRAIRGEAADVEMFVRNPKLEQGVWIEVTGRPLKDEDGVLRGGVVAFRDVTRTKASEREIRKLNDELEQRVVQRTAQLEAANKELETFTYSVSHDLRAPLRHIGGFSKILVEEFGPALDPTAQHYLQRIEEGTRRMGVLVDELLNLARVGRHSLSLQVTGLNSIVAELVSMLKPESEGRQVEWIIADLPFVECDPILIKQVLQNLMANALKFTRPRPRAVIEIGQVEENGSPAIFVRDNGVGFSMKYADKLFGVFQRLHRPEDFEGTGIGLATVQRIIQKHGGRVWVEAELDRRDILFQPRGGRTIRRPQTKETEKSCSHDWSLIMQSSGVDILLVEDSQDDMDLALHALRRENLANNIFVVRDGEQALDFLFCREAFAKRSLDHPPKLVLLDLKLPKVDGIEVLRQIKSDPRTKTIPVVIMTSSKEERDLVNGYSLGANSYIQKPVDFDQFRNTVKQVGLYWLVTNQAPVINGVVLQTTR